MGMDFRYSGSSSYPRFDNELCEVAKVFGGVETEYLKNRRNDSNKNMVRHFFGFLSSDFSNNDKFVFPKGTSEILVKWFNHIYAMDFIKEETTEIWNQISKHPEIKDISNQIWEELKMSVLNNESWYISH